MAPKGSQGKNIGKITITQDAPYIVTGSLPLTKMIIEVDEEGYPIRWVTKETYPARETYSLCRCGQSQTKPYCDGSHLKTRYKGEEVTKRVPYLENVRTYDGPELKLTDNKKLCIGAGFCTRAGNIWNLTTNSDNPEYKRTAIQEAADCPSGRLVEWDKTGNVIEPKLEPSIAVTEDQDGVSGSLWIRGGVEIESADGYKYERRNRVTLCRCGRSENNPLCDGSHLDEESTEKKP
jgi:CDGSH-type Zn-finger protein